MEEMIIETQDVIVRCDGGAGELGHPAIYISLEKTGEGVCGYCSKRFVNKALQGKLSHAS